MNINKVSQVHNAALIQGLGHQSKTKEKKNKNRVVKKVESHFQTYLMKSWVNLNLKMKMVRNLNLIRGC